MSKNFQPLSSGEVLSVSNESQIVIGHSTFRVSEFTAALKQLMLENGVGGLTPEKIDWLTANGIDCDVLRFGSDGWVKGKVRLHLEFCEDGDGEVSPDPKTEAAIEPFAPVAAAVASESVAALDDELAFDDDLAFDLDDQVDAVESIAEEISSTETLVDSKETFVQSDDSSFDDLFASDDLLAESSLEDELGEDLDLGSDEEAEAGVEATDLKAEEDSLSGIFNNDDDLFAEDEDDLSEAEEDSLSGIFNDEDDLFGDEDSSEEDESTTSDPELVLEDVEPASEEPVIAATDESDDDDLDSLFGDEDLLEEPAAESSLEEFSVDEDLGEAIAEAEDSDDDGFDDLFGDDDLLEESPAESSTEEPESAVELSSSDGLDDLFDDEDGLLEEETPEPRAEEPVLEAEENDNLDELFGDDSLEEISSDIDLDDDDSLDSFLEEDEATPEAEDNASISSEEESLESLDVSSGDIGLDELFAEESSTSDEDVLDDPFDEGPDSAIENTEDLAGLELEDESAFTFDDFDGGDSEEAVAESAESTNDDFGSDNPFFNDADDTDLNIGGANAAHDDPFADDDELVSSPFESFADGGETEIARVQLDNDDAAGSFTSDAGDLGGDDLTEDELPPEIDFGSTEDLGEFIDVSMMRKSPRPIKPEKKAESEPMSSPFDLGDSSFLDDDSDDDDDNVSLSELLDGGSSDDGDDFSFDELDEDDPLNAVTGEESEVSADIWDLE